jgi:flagellar biosynthetic protein FliQ
MDSYIAMDIAEQAIFVMIKVSMPLMLVALVVGLSISLVQALTQIQEMTLSFVPKIIAIFVALIVFMPFIGHQLNNFSQSMAHYIVQGG